jgi:glyoxylase-like metal-dependent hydrolase (beta-lactamase superfamily II)
MPTTTQAFRLPYIPLHLEHFSHEHFVTASGYKIFPMWSGEGNLSYLVANPTSSQSVLIDPDLEILGSYLLTFQQHNLQLSGIIDTHNHAEHVSAAPELRQLFDVPYYMHQDAPSSFVTHPVQDNDTVEIGGISIRFLHTPGHTPHLVSVKIDNHIFTGDSLFLKSCGRADFPGIGDPGVQFDILERLK